MKDSNHPPKWINTLFRRVCKPELLEEIEGDLLEYYELWVAEHGKAKANRLYIWHAIKFLRPYALKKSKSKNSNQLGMFKNYFKTGYRNILRSKGYSMINICGLAVGMAVAMIIGFWIQDEFAYNRGIKNYDRIAQIYQQQTFNGYRSTFEAVPTALYSELKNNYESDFKYLVMASWDTDHILSYEDTKITKHGNFMDRDAPKLLSLEMINGSLDGLNEMGSILLANSTAEALFENQDPMGKAMKIDNDLNVIVTGIYKDLPKNSKFANLQFLAPWDLYVSSEPTVQNMIKENQWKINSFQIFTQIADNSVMDVVSKKIERVKYDNLPESEKIYNAALFLHPMKDWHLRSGWDNGVQSGGYILYVQLFAIIGFFVLCLACINFMNLSTARSAKRSKEVGIRKSIGSARSQLIYQFLSESLLVVSFAYISACLLLFLSLPFFNDIIGKEINFPYDSLYFWIISIALIFIVGLMSGSYPALYLSSFQPVKVLKGTFRAGRSATTFRKALVIAQFTVSVALIVGTIAIYKQVMFTKDRPLGYDTDGIMMINMTSPDFEGKYEILRNELKNRSAILEMAQSSSPLTSVWNHSSGFSWEDKDPSLKEDFAVSWVTHDFGKTIGWKIKEGRDFSRDFASDSLGLVINEAAVKFMGIENPVGKTLRNERQGEHGTDYKIIGVVEDMLTESPYYGVKQALYFIGYENNSWIELKLNPKKSVTESVASIEQVFHSVMPNVPFEYEFNDQKHARKFRTEEKVGKLAGIFSTVAVFISCLGLFGLASFVAEQRTKEIGIRKVLGASALSLWQMLTSEFVILVLVSCVIAIPIANYAITSWLNDYQYRIDLSWWFFAIAAITALVITLITVSFQTIRAARMNSTISLRSE